MFTILSVCKGGGYRYCRTDPPHPKANAKGLYPLHRVLLENKLGRLLADGEIAHHNDEDKSNDTEGNILLQTRPDHSRLHMTVESIECECPVCGKKFNLKPYALRLRQRRRDGAPCCSRSCGRLAREVMK
jgi:hypothetical protein